MKNIRIDQTRLATCKERERNQGWVMVKGVKRNQGMEGRFVVGTSVGPTRSKGDTLLLYYYYLGKVCTYLLYMTYVPYPIFDMQRGPKKELGHYYYLQQ